MKNAPSGGRFCIWLYWCYGAHRGIAAVPGNHSDRRTVQRGVGSKCDVRFAGELIARRIKRVSQSLDEIRVGGISVIRQAIVVLGVHAHRVLIWRVRMATLSLFGPSLNLVCPFRNYICARELRLWHGLKELINKGLKFIDKNGGIVHWKNYTYSQN